MKDSISGAALQDKLTRGIDLRLPSGKIPVMGMKNQPLLNWIRESDEVEAARLCEEAGTSLGYLRQVAYGNKKPSAEKAAAFERVTGISRRVFRPDDWHLIWPELKDAATG